MELSDGSDPEPEFVRKELWREVEKATQVRLKDRQNKEKEEKRLFYQAEAEASERSRDRETGLLRT